MRTILTCSLALALSSASATAAPNEHREASLEREDLGTAARFRPTSPTAEHLMHDLLCQCPGCQPKRITIEDCACGYAARQREEVLAVLAGHDLSSAQGRAAAERAVRADQVQRYGGGVLAQPGSSLVWVVPIACTIAALGFLLVRRRARRPAPQPRPDAPPRPAEDDLDDRLDDELMAFD